MTSQGAPQEKEPVGPFTQLVQDLTEALHDYVWDKPIIGEEAALAKYSARQAELLKAAE